MGSMKTIYCLVLIVLVCVSYTAQAENLCTRKCPVKCQKKTTSKEEIRCFFTCIDNCQKCPNNPNGCDDENNGKDLLQQLDKLRGLTAAKAPEKSTPTK